MPLTPQHKRLIIVYNDYLKENPEGNQKGFAKEIGVTQGTISRMLTGEYPITRKTTDSVCLKLGYSPSWFIKGEGDKHAKKDKRTLTDVQMLRAEVDILRSEIEKMKTDILILSKGKQIVNS